MLALLASIPSPASGDFELGPLTFHIYGLILLCGILAATLLTGVRWKRWGGEWDLVLRVALWGVLGGVVGARAYHVLTSWQEIPDPKWAGVFELWRGGLGIWGAVAAGVVVGSLVVRRAGADVFRFWDAVAPGLLLAQGIGRLGNYVNQELFGKPTDLPWALRIDPENRPDEYLQFATFQPTFLYELLWNLAGVLVLLWVGSHMRLRAPGLFCLYVAWYSFGRFFEELLRIDPAHQLFGLRLNAYVAAVLFVVACACLGAGEWRSRGRVRPGE